MVIRLTQAARITRIPAASFRKLRIWHLGCPERLVMHIRFIRSLLLAGGIVLLSTAAFAQVGVSVTIAPPELPAYEQPLCPGDGYIWTPGYWAYDYDYNDYYWVPGTWVRAPQVGFLWTPGYWGWGGEAFIFHEGY